MRVGVATAGLVKPKPAWPSRLRPQPYALPRSSTANECSSPQLTPTTGMGHGLSNAGEAGKNGARVCARHARSMGGRETGGDPDARRGYLASSRPGLVPPNAAKEPAIRDVPCLPRSAPSATTGRSSSLFDPVPSAPDALPPQLCTAIRAAPSSRRPRAGSSRTVAQCRSLETREHRQASEDEDEDEGQRTRTERLGKRTRG